MSLFPAYCGPSQGSPRTLPSSQDSSSAPPAPTTWLENASFAINLEDIPLPDSPEPAREAQGDLPQVPARSRSLSPGVKKRKSSSSHRDKSKKEDEQRQGGVPMEGTDYYEDKSCARGNLMVKTLSRPAVPTYCTRYRCVGLPRLRPYTRRKWSKKRYYVVMAAMAADVDDSRVMQTEEGNKKKSGNVKDLADKTAEEEELTKRTAEFNKSLTDDPHDIEMWIRYVRFQDVMYLFERLHRHGGGSRGLRVTAERKLAILEKALHHNPTSETLLEEQIGIAESIFPADTVAQQLSEQIEKQPGSVTLWRGRIRAVQYSLSLCSGTDVLKLYEQGMGRLHQLRRGAPASHTKPMEDGILDLLLDCGLFLRQAGLWEQLWTLLKLYLDLNVAQPDADMFTGYSSVSEEYIRDLEDTVLDSQLPLPELWYRIERLREGAHWLPWSLDVDCEDPQRVVFPDDVSDMLHPVTTADLNFRLVLVAFTLLKVPLLPCRSTTFRLVGLDATPWSADCIEWVLALLYSEGIVELHDKSLFKGAASLVHGPQYLLDQWPGQAEYLEFVIKNFKSVARCLKEPMRMALCVWWLRFERFLLILDRYGHCKIPPMRKKRIKSIIKEFLKQEENRNNGLFYLEYALMENELGLRDSACRILRTAVTAQQQSGLSVVGVMCERQKAGLCKLYRTLCEFALRPCVDAGGGDGRCVALQVLVSLCGVGSLSANPDVVVAEREVVQAATKYHHITKELLAHVDTERLADGSEHLLPDFVVDWVTCHAWFLLLTKSPWEAGALLEEALTHVPPTQDLEKSPITVALCQREALYESYVSVLSLHCTGGGGAYTVLQEVLQRALREFPNNYHLLATLANVETNLGCANSSWWRLSRSFLDSSSMLVHILKVFVVKQKEARLEEARLQGHAFLHAGGPLLPSPNGRNRLAAIFKQLLSHPASRHCPLLWRLYLQFVAEQGNDASYHTAFYRAVEECPWVKMLYVDASKLLPAELPQLQDMLLEKELRIHVTPEELDILRSDSPTP